MTGPELLAILCRYINGMGIKAIQGPSNNPAPSERPYLTVYLQNVRQVGDRMIPPPVRPGETASIAIMKVATVQFYEVEGDGEAMRSVQNALQSDEFDAFVAQQAGTRPDGHDAGFSVWEIGEVVDNGFQDGTFFIPQKTMTAEFQFYDFIGHSEPRIESADVTLNNDQPFHVEVNDG